jgi:hypothetical protein
MALRRAGSTYDGIAAAIFGGGFGGSLPPRKKRVGAPASSDHATAAAQQWEVVHTRVAVRAAPDVQAALLGLRSAGQRVAVQHEVGGWVLLGKGEVVDAAKGEAWMLIHGQQVGLGQLLRRVDAQPEEDFFDLI